MFNWITSTLQLHDAILIYELYQSNCLVINEGNRQFNIVKLMFVYYSINIGADCIKLVADTYNQVNEINISDTYDFINS